MRNNLRSGGAGVRPVRPSVRPCVAQCRWHVCRRDASAGPCSRCRRHASPSAHWQRWKISRPWAPFRRCRVHTCPSRSTGLQILDQKWRAQHSPAAQSDERRQKSPSSPAWGQRGMLSEAPGDAGWASLTGDNGARWASHVGQSHRLITSRTTSRAGWACRGCLLGSAGLGGHPGLIPQGTGGKGEHPGPTPWGMAEQEGHPGLTHGGQRDRVSIRD